MTEIHDVDELEVIPHRLFLDLSSQCVGYCVAKIKKGNTQFLQDATCELTRIGAIWFHKLMKNPHKYFYVKEIIMNDFYVNSNVSDIIYERYSFSPSHAKGSLVVPEMIGAIKAACHEVPHEPLGIEDIPPQTWRAQIGLKPITDAKGKRDYKTPCIDYMRGEFGDRIPQTIVSNITGKDRDAPHDMFDALGICMGWHKKLGIEKFAIGDLAFNNDILQTFGDLRDVDE